MRVYHCLGIFDMRTRNVTRSFEKDRKESLRENQPSKKQLPCGSIIENLLQISGEFFIELTFPNQANKPIGIRRNRPLIYCFPNTYLNYWKLISPALCPHCWRGWSYLFESQACLQHHHHHHFRSDGQTFLAFLWRARTLDRTGTTPHRFQFWCFLRPHFAGVDFWYVEGIFPFFSAESPTVVVG